MDAAWQFFPIGYAITVALETPILLLGLSPQHSWLRRLWCGFWLTACTYPIVVIVLPAYVDVDSQRFWYLLIAETFAPVAECVLFWWSFRPLQAPGRDLATITLANLVSFVAGETWYYVMSSPLAA